MEVELKENPRDQAEFVLEAKGIWMTKGGQLQCTLFF